MRLVIVESPYAGDVRANEEYARKCLADCIKRGEAPFASHLLYTQTGVLNDTIPEERWKGMTAGFAWLAKADASVVYIDHGISKGMIEGIKKAWALGIPVETRTL